MMVLQCRICDFSALRKMRECLSISRMNNLYEPPASESCDPNIINQEPPVPDPWWRWIFPHRLGRLNFLVRVVPLQILAMRWMLELDDSYAKAPAWMLPSCIAAMGYIIWFVMLPRVRDCGLSPWVTILGVIPVVSSLFGLALIFKAPVTPLQEWSKER
jgi:hypothetical protein